MARFFSWASLLWFLTGMGAAVLVGVMGGFFDGPPATQENKAKLVRADASAQPAHQVVVTKGKLPPSEPAVDGEKEAQPGSKTVERRSNPSKKRAQNTPRPRKTAAATPSTNQKQAASFKRLGFLLRALKNNPRSPEVAMQLAKELRRQAMQLPAGQRHSELERCIGHAEFLSGQSPDASLQRFEACVELVLGSVE